MRPLVPEDLQRDPISEHRSLIRAVTAQVIAARSPGQSAETILRKTWPDDRRAATILRAPTTPLSTGSVPQPTPLLALVLLAPQSAALRLFETQLGVDLGPTPSVRIPNVQTAPVAVFVPEMSAGPVVQPLLGSVTLGPVRKILLLAALTEEVALGSPQSASDVIGYILAMSAARSLDLTAFDANADDGVRPAGLLHNVTPIGASAARTTVLETIVADIGGMASAMAGLNIDPEGMVIVAAPRQATTLRLLAGPRFDSEIYSSTGLPDGTVAGFARGAIAATFEGTPSVEVSKSATVQFSDTPAGLLDGPTFSTFQQNMLTVRLRQRGTWAVVAPGGVQSISGVNW